MAMKTLGLRRNLKAEHRQKAITEAAIKVFSTKGYDQATMDDIVLESGCSKSLIYWYFAGKAALFGGLLDRCMTDHVEMIDRALGAPKDFWSRFQDLLEAFTEYYNENKALNRLVHFGSLHISDAKADNFSRKLNSYHEAILNTLEHFFQEGVAEGAVRSDIDAAALAYFLTAVVSGHHFMSIHEDRMPVGRGVFGVVVDYLIPRMKP
jgi:AcrR family transcriptional regulator